MAVFAARVAFRLRRNKVNASFTASDDCLKESSANWDKENVRPFLERVSGLVERGFAAKEIDTVMQTIDKMDVDDETDMDFSIRYKGKTMPVNIRIFMDDIDSPDIAIMTCCELAEKIDDLTVRFCEQLGI